VRPVPEAHIKAVRPHVSRQVEALIDLQLLTGARPGELLGLRPLDIDTSAPIWTHTPAVHKTSHRGRARTIYVGPRAQEIIRPFLTRDATRPMFSPKEAQAERHAACATHRRPGAKPNTRTTTRKVGDTYSVPSYARSIARACELAGVPHWSPNRLRHNCATTLRRTFGLEAAQVMLGHARADVTQVYAERDEAKAREVVAKVG
jgi:integrase